MEFCFGQHGICCSSSFFESGLRSNSLEKMWRLDSCMFTRSNAIQKTAEHLGFEKKIAGLYPFRQIQKIIVSKLFCLDYKVTVEHLALSYFITCDV